MNRAERRRIIRPWRFKPSVLAARAVKRAKMPKGYYETARRTRRKLAIAAFGKACQWYGMTDKELGMVNPDAA